MPAKVLGLGDAMGKSQCDPHPWFILYIVHFGSLASFLHRSLFCLKRKNHGRKHLVT
jgi:hypothetical protein